MSNNDLLRYVFSQTSDSENEQIEGYLEQHPIDNQFVQETLFLCNREGIHSVAGYHKYMEQQQADFLRNFSNENVSVIQSKSNLLRWMVGGLIGVVLLALLYFWWGNSTGNRQELPLLQRTEIQASLKSTLQNIVDTEKAAFATAEPSVVNWQYAFYQNDLRLAKRLLTEKIANSSKITSEEYYFSGMLQLYLAETAADLVTARQQLERSERFNLPDQQFHLLIIDLLEGKPAAARERFKAAEVGPTNLPQPLRELLQKK